MDLSGIIAQYGFEYQKLAFVYYAIQMNNTDSIIYEGQDDVEIEDEKSIVKLQTGRKLCQVKSGTITLELYKRILLNWLLKIDQADQFICLTENPFSLPAESFVEDFSTSILKSNKKKSALISQVKSKYSSQKNADDLKEDIKKLLKKTEIICKKIDTLIEESIKKFAEFYCGDTTSEIIHKERYLVLSDNIHKKITQSIIKKEKCFFSYRMVFQEISAAREAISASKYDVSFTEFKKRSSSKMEKVLNSESDAVKQLKLVFPFNDNAIIQGLTEQMFYEDLRQHFIGVNKQIEIDDLEHLAKFNYDETLQDFEGYGETRTPYSTYRTTIEKKLSKPLPPEDSPNFVYYKHGCYIHLTDTDVEEDLKIKWGDVDDETN